MGGMISTGTEYKNQALSGFIRESAQEEEMDRANKEHEANKKVQKVQQQTTTAMAGATVGWMVGAEMGTWGGPIGMVVGAGLGYLFSSLF
jgi:hypothetical protein